MRLPDSASIFTAEVWAAIKPLEQIEDILLEWNHSAQIRKNIFGRTDMESFRLNPTDIMFYNNVIFIEDIN